MASESKPGRTASDAGRASSNRGQRRRSARRDIFALDQEQSSRLLLIAAVVGVIVLALGFIGYGYYDSVIKPRHRTVLEADGLKISYDDMRRQMRYQFSQNPALFSQNAQLIPDLTYAQLLEELTLVSRAAELGVTIEPAEIEQKFRQRIGTAQDADARTYADAIRRELDKTGLQEDEIRLTVQATALRQKVREKLEAEIPAQLLQSRVEVISVIGEEAANAVIGRINAGEDWATVAKEVSTQSDVQTTGGLVDYTPEALQNTYYRSYALTAPPGEVSGPLVGGTTPDGTTYFVVRVVDRSEQPLAETNKGQYASSLYNDWITEVQTRMNVRQDFDDQSKNDALLWVLNHALPSPQEPFVPEIPPVQQAPAPDTGGEQPPVDTAPDSGVEQPPSDSGAPVVPDQPVAPGAGDGQ
ncbi:MAG: SurA N-terminal domain-containing protein [Dehalococcoidia bacterium]